MDKLVHCIYTYVNNFTNEAGWGGVRTNTGARPLYDNVKMELIKIFWMIIRKHAIDE